MRKLFFSELTSCKETKLQAATHSWLPLEKGKLSKFTGHSSSSSSIESLMKMPEPPVLPHFKPADYVDILAQIHEELEYCPPDERSCLYLLQFQVFRGLGEAKLSRRSLQAAWEKASTIHEKLIFGAWLKYEKREEESISDLLGSCGKCSQEFKLLDFVSSLESHGIGYDDGSDEFRGSPVVHFRIRDDMIACDRRKLAALSTPLYAMLNGGFKESHLEVIDMSQNGISPIGMRAISGFSLSGRLPYLFCCYLALEDYRAALCDVQAILTLAPDYRMIGGRVAAKQLRTLVMENVEQWTTADCWMQLYDRWSSVDDIGSLSVIYQMLESDAAKGVLYFRQSLLLLRLNCPEAAMRSLQLAREHAASQHERLVYEGWILYDTGHCEEGLQKAEASIAIQRSFEAFFLKAYALADSSLEPSTSATVVSLLEDALRCPSDRLRKGQALNNLGSVYVDCGNLDLAAECYINALKIGHTRAHQGLARVHFLRNNRTGAFEEMTKLIEKARSNASAYEKRSEYCDRDLTKADLQMVTKLDPLRVYPYRYRAAVLMDNHKEKDAISELTKAIAFKADLNLLHLRAAFHEHVGDISGALRDCRAALSVDPNHQEMLELHHRVNSQEP
uniref:Uncharacterized protein n=1 Tax=Avena sativa TaxID=4498 RepID=A0ACD6ACF2_AVESA